MVKWIGRQRHGLIGVDLGSRSVKLVQLTGDRGKVLAAGRSDLPDEMPADAAGRDRLIATAIEQAREGRHFHGRGAVVCLGAGELFVQNIRVNKVAGAELDKAIRQEAAGKLPFPLAEAELRYLDAGDVRQGDSVKREVILLACHRPVLQRTLRLVEAGGLRPLAVNIEPAAMLRCYAKQFRRDEDQQQRAMFVHVGGANTAVVIARGDDALFIKYLELGGRHFDEAVARHLGMELPEAIALRRQNSDRRADQQDPEVARTVTEAIRPVVERLAGELSLCARYHTVTFRGQPLIRTVIGGGEATQTLIDALNGRLEVKCELGDPLRSFDSAAPNGRKSQWDIAAGLALRDVN